MARLKAGETPTPHKERLKVYRADLGKRGGKRVSVDLECEPTRALQAIMARDETTAKEAISSALIHFAKPADMA